MTTGQGVKLALSVLALALGVSFAPAELSRRNQMKSDQLFQEGLEKEKKGDLRGAQEDFRKALDENPDHGPAQLELGRIALAEKEYEKARSELRKAEEIFRRSASSRQEMARKNYQNAQKQLIDEQARLIQLQQPGPVTNQMSEATLAQEIRETEERIRKLQAMPPPDTTDATKPPPDLYFLLGNAEMRLDRLDEAIVDWEKCRGIAPNFGPVYNNLAFAYWKRGRVSEAREALAKAEELGVPVNPEFKQRLAEATGQ